MPNITTESFSAPQIATYKKIRIPFAQSLNLRNSDETIDSLLLNFLVETYTDPITKEERSYIIKRPGTIDFGAGTNYPSISPAEGRGVFVWRGHVLSAFGNKVYFNATEIQTLATSTGQVGFCPVATSTTHYCFFCDGTNAYRVNESGTVVAATGEPSPHIPTPVFIDGYVFLATSNGDIYNSNLEDFTTWNASNFISAELDPDELVGLSKQNNNLIAFGRLTSQFFYDAGNTTGTPLAVVPNAALNFGTRSSNSFVRFENLNIFVAESKLGDRGVWLLDGFEVKKISTPQIDRFLTGIGPYSPTFNCSVFKVSGHYLLMLQIAIDASGNTLIYDIDEKVWTKWSFFLSYSHFPYKWATSLENDNYTIVQHKSEGTIARLSKDIYKDVGDTVIHCYVRTLNLDFGNDNRKFMHSLRIIGDKRVTGGPNEGDQDLATTLPIIFRYNDNDYDTTSWSSYKEVDLITQPYWKRLGFFRRRAFEFIFLNTDYPIRVEAFEVDLNQGMN